LTVNLPLSINDSLPPPLSSFLYFIMSGGIKEENHMLMDEKRSWVNVLRLQTMRPKLPQDAINPAHGSLLWAELSFPWNLLL